MITKITALRLGNGHYLATTGGVWCLGKDIAGALGNLVLGYPAELGLEFEVDDRRPPHREPLILTADAEE